MKHSKRGKTEEDRGQFENLFDDIHKIQRKQEIKPIITKYSLNVITDINLTQTQKNITNKNKTCSDVNTIVQI
jgi:hypothetical protein